MLEHLGEPDAAAAVLAAVETVLARGGVRVLLLGRQRAYRDRVRGEYMAPWGVLEARALGLEDVIRSTRAVDARYSVGYDELVDPSAAEAARRDNSTVFPGVPGGLCASHPRNRSPMRFPSSTLSR